MKSLLLKIRWERFLSSLFNWLIPVGWRRISNKRMVLGLAERGMVETETTLENDTNRGLSDSGLLSLLPMSEMIIFDISAYSVANVELVGWDKGEASSLFILFSGGHFHRYFC